MRHCVITFTLALLLAGTGAHADTAMDAARDFLQRHTQDPGSTVTVTVREPSAALPVCQQPQPFLPGNGQRLLGRVTVGIRCGDQVRYLQARITATGQYWVARRRIATGTTITTDLLRRREGDLSRLPHQAIVDRSQALGQVTTRTLAAGSVLQSTQLRAPQLVHRRQPVTVEAHGRGFQVSRQGEALQSGSRDDVVRVRMADRSVLSATVSGAGRVTVIF